MSNYKLSNLAKEDLIRIHHYGTKLFGAVQADKYFDAFFDQFNLIAERPYSFPTVDYIKPGYRRCVCGVDSIYFRIKDDLVEIIAIIGRQDLEQIQQEGY